MSKVKLTAKQEKFVQGLIAGLSQRESYKQAGYSVKGKDDNYIDSNASRLLKNRKVLTRYRELLKESSDMVLWSREQAFEEYEWLKNKAKEDIELEGVRKATADAFIQSLDGMNEMAFKDLEVTDQKLMAEIKKLEAEAELAEQKANEATSTNDFKLEIVDEWSEASD